MNNLTKRDIVVEVSKKTNLTQEDVMKAFQSSLDVMSQSLSKGKNIELRNFGVFEVKVHKARIGRNPNKPEKDIIIPPRKIIKFKTGKSLKEKLKELNSSSSSNL